MLLNLSARSDKSHLVSEVDRTERFYEQKIGLRKLYRFGDLSFFECG